MSRPFPGGGGDVESGRGGRDRASSGDPGGAAASGQQTSSSSYGSLRDDRRGGAAARGDYVVPQYHRAVPEESAVARCFRVSEPIIFWTACTLIAAFSCISMIRITRSPHFPASLPEGRDGRTVQVGYVANSTEALESYEGCRVTRGGSKLRNDMGVRRFPDFIVAGARGAPLDDLHRLLSEKNVACAATDDGNAVIHWAAWQGGVSAVRTLLAAGADAHVANDRGCTCAHWAAAGGDTDTLAYLRDVCRVDLRTPNAAGHTPLEHACAYKRTDIVSWLVSEEVVDPRAVEYALRVAALDADDANLRAITGMLVPNI